MIRRIFPIALISFLSATALALTIDIVNGLQTSQAAIIYIIAAGFVAGSVARMCANKKGML